MARKFRRHPELVRLGDKWRKPKSRTNKIRKKLKGRKLMPTIGYGSCKAEKNMHPSGLFEVMVSNAKELEKIDKNKECARILVSVGRKKKMEIVKAAEKMKIKVLNPRKIIENKKSGDKTQIPPKDLKNSASKPVEIESKNKN
ncbi:MAG: 50S ribosomal protein L32e [Candidatus Aenigmarchaeota archaeon]|nr:50S ribosomal protein L32e [Candidatus Aenigmarchaeota archaeon]